MRQRSGIEKRGDLGLGRLQRRLGILARPDDGIDGTPDDIANLIELIQARRVLAVGQFLEDTQFGYSAAASLSVVAIVPDEESFGLLEVLGAVGRQMRDELPGLSRVRCEFALTVSP